MPASFNLTNEDMETLIAYNVSVGGYMKAGGFYGTITDNDTGETYIISPGEDRPTAFHNAISLVPHTPKPKTRSQKLAEESASKQASDARDLADINTALLRKIAELEGKISNLSAKAGGVSLTEHKPAGRFPNKPPKREVATDSTAPGTSPAEGSPDEPD